MKKIEIVGFCGGGVCVIGGIVAAIALSPTFLALIPVGFVVMNSCNIKKIKK